MFSTFNNEDKRVIFADVFSEFIEELNLVDLSKETLQHLNDIFEKDMKLFFKELDKMKGGKNAKRNKRKKANDTK